jgi:drug/metabolite transporter (DMT)-like permease
MKDRGKITNWAILVILALIWGTSFILIKRGLQSFSSIQIASLRVFITYLALLPIAVRHLKKISKENIFSLIIIGAIGNGIPALLFPVAQTKLDSTTAGMLNSLTPLFTLTIGVILYKRKATWKQILGIVLGLVGATGLLYKGDLSFEPIGLLIVLATLLYGISSNQVTKVKGLNGVVLTSLAFFLIGPFAGINLLFTDFSQAVESENWLRNLGFIVILAVIGSAFALALFNVLIIRTSPIFAVTVTYLAPLVSTLWGVVDGELITVFMIISIIIILTGVYLSNRKRRVVKESHKIIIE